MSICNLYIPDRFIDSEVIYTLSTEVIMIIKIRAKANESKISSNTLNHVGWNVGWFFFSFVHFYPTIMEY